jgi:hypothetical protein
LQASWSVTPKAKAQKPNLWAFFIAVPVICIVFFRTVNAIARFTKWLKAPGSVPSKLRAAALTWVKNRAFRLLKADLEQALVYRDQYWRGEITRLTEQYDNRPTGAIPSIRMKALLNLCHPDKHPGSRIAHETTQWLLAQRKAA